MAAQPTTAIQEVATHPIVDQPMNVMSITLIRERMTAIQQLVKEAMVIDVDYGTIPGCGDKPALFKPGAEMICTMFRLVPKFDTITRDLPNGHREYQVTVTLVYGPSGQFWGQGVGMCSTMESKYRYRGTQVEPTGVDLPRGYWDLKDFAAKEKFLATAMNAPSGKDFAPKKIDGRWQICRKTAEKMENQDPADQFNTALKMAKKRALVDATLTATAASRIFSQDMEDLEEMIQNTPVQVESKAVRNGSAVPRDQRVIEAFSKYGANQKDIEELAKCKRGEWGDAEYAIFEETWAALTNGEQQPGDVFPRLAAKAEDPPAESSAKQGSMFGGSKSDQAAFKR